MPPSPRPCVSAYRMCKQANLFKHRCTGRAQTHKHMCTLTHHFTPTFTYSHSNLLQKPALRGLICASVPSLVKFKRVNKSLPPEQPSSSPFHVHICSLYVQKSTEARPDSVGIGLAEELEAFQLLASVVPLPRAAGSQLMAMLGTQRERTVADFPKAIAPIPAHHQLQMSHQQLETFRLMLRFSESLGQMFLTFSLFRHITQHCQVCLLIWGILQCLETLHFGSLNAKTDARLRSTFGPKTVVLTVVILSAKC